MHIRRGFRSLVLLLESLESRSRWLRCWTGPRVCFGQTSFWYPAFWHGLQQSRSSLRRLSSGAQLQFKMVCDGGHGGSPHGFLGAAPMSPVTHHLELGSRKTPHESNNVPWGLTPCPQIVAYATSYLFDDVDVLGWEFGRRTNFCTRQFKISAT